MMDLVRIFSASMSVSPDRCFTSVAVSSRVSDTSTCPRAERSRTRCPRSSRNSSSVGPGSVTVAEISLREAGSSAPSPVRTTAPSTVSMLRAASRTMETSRSFPVRPPTRERKWYRAGCPDAATWANAFAGSVVWYTGSLMPWRMSPRERVHEKNGTPS